LSMPWRAQETKKPKTEHLTLYDLNRYFDGPTIRNSDGKKEVRPIKGNHRIRMLPTLLWGIKGRSVIIEGDAGSGKSEIEKATMVLLFEDEALDDESRYCALLDTATDQAFWTYNKIDQINSCDRVYIPEIQNVENHFPMLKKWMEGAIFKKDARVGNTSIPLKLPPRPILSCLAINNDKIKKLPDEIIRRMIHLWAESGEKLNKSIHNMKADIESLPECEYPQMPIEEVQALRTKLIIAMNEHRRVVNVYANAIQEFIPATFTVSNSYIGEFFNLIQAIAIFNAEQRYTTGEYIFASIADNYLAILISGDLFPDMCLGIQGLGREIIRQMTISETFGSLRMDDRNPNEASGYYTITQIMDIQKYMGKQRDAVTTEELLDKYCRMGYLGKEKIKGTEYYVRISDFEKNTDLDWKKIYNDGLDRMGIHWSEHSFKFREIEHDEYVVPFGENAGETVHILEDD